MMGIFKTRVIPFSASVAVIVGAVALSWASPAAAQTPEATLEGRAMLPADTFAPGPPSGSGLDADEVVGGRETPFEGQPVGGVSAMLDAGDGEYLVMADNGFGTKGNSADFLLRLYRVRPDFGSGDIRVRSYIQLRDPDQRIPFEITNENTAERFLTGADFDIESVRQDFRGDLWFGDEFGPFLLHTDAYGRVLEAPIPLEGVRSPENPSLGSGEEPNLPSSKGLEGMAASPDGAFLYPMLEGALGTDPEQRRRSIFEFDVASGRYTGARWEYRAESPENSIGDLVALDANRFLVIERDNEQGEAARFKKIFLIDLRSVGEDGFLLKEEVADLLSIADPARISEPTREGDVGLGERFSFPFQTVESILPLGDGSLLIINDNNYPLSAGRNPDRPDDTEAIIVRPFALPATGGPPILVPVAPLAGVFVLLALRRTRRSPQRTHGARHAVSRSKETDPLRVFSRW
jgi:hypothetical protein